MLKDSLRDILDDRASGSSALYRRVITLFLSEPWFHGERRRRRVLEQLRRTFPEMTVFAYLHDALADVGETEIIEKLRKLQREADNEIESIGRRMDRLWKSPRRIVTFSQSSVVAAVLLARRHKIQSIVLSTASPSNEGILAARRFARAGIPVTIVADAVLPGLIAKRDYLVIGADGVTEDTLLNKAGTFPLLLAAREAGAVSFALYERFKEVSGHGPVSAPRNHAPKEIFSGTHPNITVRNPYFEAVPRHYVDWLVSGLRAVHGK